MLKKHKLTNLFLIVSSIIVISLISTFSPQQYVVTIFVLYIVVSYMIFWIIQRMRRGKKVDVKKIKPLVKVSREEIVKAVERDAELGREISQLVSRMVLSILSMPIIFWFIFPPLKDFYMSLAHQFAYMDQLLRTFAGYIMLYSTLTIMAHAMRVVVMPRKNIMPVLNEYIVGREGIYSKDIFISFPLDRTRFVVEVNIKRGFVEIYDRHTNQAYRFYSNDVKKIVDIIERMR